AVTGANRGLGRALVLALAARGARVLVHGRDPSAAEPVADACRDAGAAEVLMVTGDLRDDTLGTRLATAAEEAWGGLDLLLLNAAILGPMVPFKDLDPDAVRDVLEVDVTRQVPLVQGALPGMVDQGNGVVLWMTSYLGRFGLPHYGAYAAAKHALEGLMKVVAQEHGDDGLVSLAVAPGMVQTDMLRAALGTDDVSEWQSPEETAKAFVRLLEDLTPEHNGVTLDIESWLPQGD
ncbi:MAG: SDR family oxidoreductase, partial [Myxococcota bacterium]|nr:SDR family oxidoreductase [Myxococcota bacterium]